jgi:hypothetical protein
MTTNRTHKHFSKSSKWFSIHRFGTEIVLCDLENV